MKRWTWLSMIRLVLSGLRRRLLWQLKVLCFSLLKKNFPSPFKEKKMVGDPSYLVLGTGLHAGSWAGAWALACHVPGILFSQMATWLHLLYSRLLLKCHLFRLAISLHASKETPHFILLPCSALLHDTTPDDVLCVVALFHVRLPFCPESPIKAGSWSWFCSGKFLKQLYSISI